MRKGLLFLVLLATGCCLVPNPPNDATYWVRSDDYDEYSGLYLYSHSPDGKLWITDYPDKDAPNARSTKLVGRWGITNRVITWRMTHYTNIITYVADSNGVYIQQEHRHYDLPIALVPFDLYQGRPERRHVDVGGGAR